MAAATWKQRPKTVVTREKAVVVPGMLAFLGMAFLLWVRVQIAFLSKHFYQPERRHSKSKSLARISTSDETKQQRQQQPETEDDTLEQYRSHVKDRFDLNRTQTTTGGAFVHMGKTGGSSLSVLLRNGCHSWLQHPCRVVPHETLASQQISSYYHVADFGFLPQSHHDFYLLTTRDPLDRTISAFVYEHYTNVQARGEEIHIPQRIRHDFAQACQICFPTLETFVALLGGGGGGGNLDSKSSKSSSSSSLLEFQYPYPRNQVVWSSCPDLARAVLFGRVRIFHHLYFNYQRIQSLIPNMDQKIVLATRLDHLWSDWEAVNQYLATTNNNNSNNTLATAAAAETANEPTVQSSTSSSSSSSSSKKGTVNHPLETGSSAAKKHIRNTAKLSFQVTRDLSPSGRKILCRALQPEYDTYFWILSRARNLQKMDVVQSLWAARQQCPELSIDFKALQPPPPRTTGR